MDYRFLKTALVTAARGYTVNIGRELDKFCSSRHVERDGNPVPVLLTFSLVVGHVVCVVAG